MSSLHRKSADLNALKELLLEPEQQSINELKDQITNLEYKLNNKKENTMHFSQMIAETIQTRVEKDNDLQEVLKPIIREALYEMIDKNPNVVIKAFLNAFKDQKSSH
jgi:hypothetical protein